MEDSELKIIFSLNVGLSTPKLFNRHFIIRRLPTRIEPIVAVESPKQVELTSFPFLNLGLLP